jgi:ABC-type uncharacterized transport system involved in gliding motility auxiliary subunit
MLMKNLPQALKYLVWPGLMLLTAGGVIGVLTGWTVLAVAFLIVGALLLVAGVAAGDYASGRFWQRRATQASTNAAVSVLSVLVILGFVNFLGARYDSRVDLTEGQLLTLSPATQQVVKDLKNPTELLIFAPAPNPADQQLLDNYRRINADFSYRYIDPYADPQLARTLGVKTGTEVFLKSGDRTSLVQQAITPEEPLTERKITNKLAQLGQENVAVAYFLQGHEEYAIDGSKAGYLEAATELESQNYTVAPLNLAETGTVPTDADVVIIAGAQKALFENEVTAIQNYLNDGGSVLALIDPKAKTGLEVLLSQWGVVPENTLVIDTSGGGQLVGLGPAAPLVQDYGDHPITNAFGNGRSFFPVTRPLQVREVPGVEETPLLFTNQNSHAQPMTEGDLSIDPNQAPEGPLTIGVALSRPVATASQSDNSTTSATDKSAADKSVADKSAIEKSATEKTAEKAADASMPTAEEAIENSLPEEALLDKSAAEKAASDEPPNDSRLVVIGNSSFGTDGLFSQQLNGDVFLNSVNWLSKVDKPVLSIRPKEATNRRFNMTFRQQLFLALLALVGFPLAGLIGAGTLWVKRR